MHAKSWKTFASKGKQIIAISSKENMIATTKCNANSSVQIWNAVTLLCAQKKTFILTDRWDQQLPKLKAFYFEALLPAQGMGKVE